MDHLCKVSIGTSAFTLDQIMTQTFRLAAPVEVETLIRKSRFIAMLHPVSARGDAAPLLEAIRRAHPGAHHVCVALLAPDGSRLDDDGEPSGTAARPMHAVLEHRGVGDVLAVVVRYFGGVKLGAGGLVRAYGQAVSAALDAAVLQPVVARARRRLRVALARESLVRQVLRAQGATVLAVGWEGETVLFDIEADADALSALLDRLQDALSGRLVVLMPPEGDA